MSELKLNDFIKAYEEIKKQNFIVDSINKDFFLEFAECLLSNYKKQKQLNEELQQKINDLDIDLTTDKELENARKINEEHRKENGLLREKVKELEEENLHWRGQ